MTVDRRIIDLPRRNWRDRVPEAEAITECLRAPGSSAQLRPIQGVSLLEISELGGAFVSARVGAGKTLIDLLAGELLLEERILICTPGGLKRECEKLFEEYRIDWPADWQGTHYKLLGYSDVSRFPSLGMSIDKLFGGLGPTLIICDEVDKLRRVGDNGAGVANQFAVFMAEHPDVRMVALTGTPRKGSLLDYAHILAWTLKERSPLPLDRDEQQDWADVIDRGDMLRSARVCAALGIDEDSPLDVIRAAFHDRLRQTPGVIVSDDQFTGPLSIRMVLVEPVGMEQHFHKLRREYQRPDGWELSPEGPPTEEGGEERRPDMVTGGTIWACARQMALGFCYVADPVPPLEWREARRAYFRLVRRKINSGEYFTEFQVRQACISGHIRSEAWAEWVKIEPSFTPAFKPLWFSDHAIEFCQDWGATAPGVIWTDHRAFALRLAKETGWTYYGAQGLDSRKHYISDDNGRAPIIASRAANGTGRNLQRAFHRMLFTAAPSCNRDFEQNVGRMHRDEQERPVEVDILLGCMEHVGSCANVLDDAAVCDQTLMQQKATLVGWDGPEKLPTSIAFGD